MHDLGHGRVAMAVRTVLARLREAVLEIEPSEAEFRAALDWLADVGRITDDAREEWVLLSDALGVSALVDAADTRRDARATANTVAGPFYLRGAPSRDNGADICATPGGEPMAVEARVTDLAGAPVAGARVVGWRADHTGAYESQRPDVHPEGDRRGAFRADAEGRVRWRTVKPARCASPADGPVGALMRSFGRDLRPPAHFHLRASAAGFETLITHIFDDSDPALDHDPIFSVRGGLAGRFAVKPGNARRVDAPTKLQPRGTC